MGKVISCHIPKGGNFKTTSVQALTELLSRITEKKYVVLIQTASVL